MFGIKKNKAPVALKRIDSLIGAGTVISGDIEFMGGLRVDGHVKGSITSSGEEATLMLSEKAVVEGKINVSHIVINGRVDGPVHASTYLELLAGARISGDVLYKTLEMQVGAVVDGRLVHEQAATSTVVELKREAVN